MQSCTALVLGWTWPSLLVLVVMGALAPVRAEPTAPAAVSAAAPGPSIEAVADRLARRWAPVYVQHVDPDDRGRDRPTRIDFDGNWDATDNWAHQAELATNLPPAAYSAAVLTRTHAYLTYTLFYPRDWTWFCVPIVCHDNDLESVQLVVARDAHEGRLVAVRVKAHDSMSDVRGDAVARSPDGHPILRVDTRGHGIRACSPDDPACEARDGRLVYVPDRVASPPPRRARGQRVGYELLSLRDTLWVRRGRAHDRLWTDGETGPLYYQGRYRGRLGHAMGAAMATTRFGGGVRPPWALAGRFGKRGDWFLDPAADRDPAARYVYNPFLADLASECKQTQCARAPRQRWRLRYYARLGAPYAVLALGTVVLTGLLRSRASKL